MPTYKLVPLDSNKETLPIEEAEVTTENINDLVIVTVKEAQGEECEELIGILKDRWGDKPFLVTNFEMGFCTIEEVSEA